MIVDLKPYPSYKNPGVPWLGDVPEHWKVCRIKALFREKDERNRNGNGLLLSLTRLKGLIPQSEASDRIASAEDFSKYKVCSTGDLVMNRMQAWTGMFAVSAYVGIVSPDYSVFSKIHNLEVNYFEHLFKTPRLVAEFAKASKGIGSGFNRLYTPDFSAISVCLPPPPEQAAIVRYLDHMDQDIRRYIRAKQKLIKLLEEQKQAIIHRAVTRGLDPNVPLKPSGVEWLGDVPAHWELTQLKRFWSVTDCKHLTVPFTDEGFPLASVREVQSFDLNLLTAKRTSEEWYSNLIEGDRKPKFGDLIYCRNVSVGACAYVDSNIDFAMGQDVCLIRSKTQNSRYLNYLLCSNFMKSQLSQILVGSTFNRINVVDIKALQILIPPVEEQNLISTLLDSHVKQYEQPITLIKKEIQTLIEYCTRLIADVVTGKVDVREIASKLPEMDESDILEEAVLDDEVVDTDEADLSEEDADADE